MRAISVDDNDYILTAMSHPLVCGVVIRNTFAVMSIYPVAPPLNQPFSSLSHFDIVTLPGISPFHPATSSNSNSYHIKLNPTLFANCLLCSFCDLNTPSQLVVLSSSDFLPRFKILFGCLSYPALDLIHPSSSLSSPVPPLLV